MPLTKRQFDLGIDEEGEELMRQVYRLLAEHRDLAYSFEELKDTILGGVITAYNQASKYSRALDVLAEIGALDIGEVEQTDYDTFLQEFDTGTWYSAKHTLSSP